jgi:cytochrome c-type biogenesis protein CcmH
VNLFCLLVALTLTETAPTRMGTATLAPQQEAQVQAIGKKLRCAVCQGVSIADSPASMARAQLDKVRELVVEGKNEEEILLYFEARYGEWARMEPKKSGVTLGLWLFPVALLLIGAIVIVMSARKKSALPSELQVPSEDDELLKQIRNEVSK